MTLPPKFTLPDIAREDLRPQDQELRAWIEQLVEVANGLQQEVEQLKQKAARLKKARGT